MIDVHGEFTILVLRVLSNASSEAVHNHIHIKHMMMMMMMII